MRFIDLLNNYGNVILHGKGDSVSPFDVDRNELIVGLYVEREHTDNHFLALKISIDHIVENPKYYTELVESGIVDEPKALELAKRFLNVVPIDNVEKENSLLYPDGWKEMDGMFMSPNNPMYKLIHNKSENDVLTDVLLGFKPRNVGDYTNTGINENFDFTAAEIENFGKPEMKQKLIRFESLYDHWRDLSPDEKNEAFALYKELNMYRYDIQC